jgi:hypothetical protein
VPEAEISFIQTKPIFQSPQLPWTQSESPLAPKSPVSFKIFAQLWTAFFIFWSGVTVTGLERVYYICVCVKSAFNLVSLQEKYRIAQSV